MRFDYQFELRHVRYFLALAETLHFRKAAELLFISQPGLSRQLQDLETTLGFKLFERTNRSVSLTPAGHSFQKSCKQILGSFSAQVEVARNIAEGKTGVLKIGFVGSAMQKTLPEFIRSVKKKFPKVELDLKEMGHLETLKKINQHEIDFGFTRMKDVPKNISIKSCEQDYFSLVVPKNYPVQNPNLKDLKDESFILFNQKNNPMYYEQIMQIFEWAGFTPKVSHRTLHAYSIFKLVENNLGLAIVPNGLTKGYQMKTINIPLDSLPFRTDLNLIWHQKSMNPLVRQLVD